VLCAPSRAAKSKAVNPLDRNSAEIFAAESWTSGSLPTGADVVLSFRPMKVRMIGPCGQILVAASEGAKG
jgi:hypothetical protein